MIAGLLLAAAAAGSLNGAPLTGAWALDRIDAVLPADGRVVANEAVADADHATGLLLYDPGGWVSLQIGAGGRAPDRSGAIGRARSITTGSYYAYYGRYAYDRAHGTVTHRIVNSLMPPEIGLAYLRHFRIDGDRLTLTSDPVARPGGMRVNRAVFHRLSPSPADTGTN